MMFKYYVLVLFSLCFFSCMKYENSIETISIGPLSHVVGNHYRANINICFKNKIGSGNYTSFLFTTNSGRTFEYGKGFYKQHKKCVVLETRGAFQHRHTSERDLNNIKEIYEGNIKELRIRIKSSSGKKEIVSDQTFMDL